MRVIAEIDQVRECVDWNPEQAENLEAKWDGGMRKVETRVTRVEKRL